MKTRLPRRFILWTAVAVLVTAGMVGAFVFQQASAAYARAATELEALQQRVAVATAQADDIRLATRLLAANGYSALNAARGHTFDDTALTAVQRAILQLDEAARAVSSAESRISAAWIRADDAFSQAGWWPSETLDSLQSIEVTDATPTWTTAREHFRAAMSQLSNARASWQAEQDRIAAEAAAAAQRAAAEAAARSNATHHTSREGVAIEANAVTVLQETPESYLAQLEPRATVEWVPNLCQDRGLCGYTLLGGSTPPDVQLDADLQGDYQSYRGLYVLTHEAAHARSWYRYGSFEVMSAVAVSLTGIQPPAGETFSRAAVEYMADCATMVKLGHDLTGLNTYTQTCTAPQLAEGATYW
ncbi:MAG: hypothetical protein ACKOXM_03940 [Agromyces sp.]